ncbi:MAG: hypothetical protein DRP15_03340, partial [Candidatus Aenigmatarchaeota archaeon]
MGKEIRTRMCILDVDYVIDDDKNTIRIWGKTEDGKTIVAIDNGFVPYFYVEPNEITEKLKKEIMELKVQEHKVKKLEVVEKKIYGEPRKLLKIYVDNFRLVPKFRNIIKEWKDVKEEYEYALSFYKRYIIDKDIIPMMWVEVTGESISYDVEADLVLEIKEIKKIELDRVPQLRTVAFDIEVVQKGEREEIIMVSLMGNGIKKVITHGKGKSKGMVTVVNDEKSLLEEFIKTIKELDPDIIVGYNTDRYDFIKIDQKCEDYNVPLVLGRTKRQVVFKKRGRISSAYIEGRVHIDLYDFVEHILGPSLSTEILTLDRVAKELLVVGKDGKSWRDIEKSWKNGDLESVAEYCIKDSELTLKLSEHILPQIFELSR